VRRVGRRLRWAQKILTLCLRGYRRAVQAAQEQVKRLTKDTAHDLWPWLAAAAGYRVQAGKMPFSAVPAFVGRLGSAPVVAVAKFSGKLAAGAWAKASRLVTGAAPAARAAPV
jgi:hypothetical protein